LFILTFYDDEGKFVEKSLETPSEAWEELYKMTRDSTLFDTDKGDSVVGGSDRSSPQQSWFAWMMSYKGKLIKDLQDERANERERQSY